jgi:hypothetical protein
MSGSGVIALVPSWGGLDFVIRFAIAGAVALYAVYARKDWLAYAAASITCPILAFSRFAPWVALWQFRRRSATGSTEPASREQPIPAEQAAA